MEQKNLACLTESDTYLSQAKLTAYVHTSFWGKCRGEWTLINPFQEEISLFSGYNFFS